MSLQEKIYEELKTALKEKDELKLSTLRLLKSDIQYDLTKTGASTISDEKVMQIVKSNISKRKETSIEYRKANRVDLAEKEEKEAKILEVFLPPSASESELKEIIQRVIVEMKPKGPQEAGKVIGKVMFELKGKNVDGSLVAELVKSSLNS